MVCYVFGQRIKDLPLVQKIRIARKTYKRFGWKAILFLLRSKYRRNRLENITLKGVEHPIQLSNFGNDVTTLFQIFWAKEYDFNQTPPPGYIVDCGANIGLSAVFFANKYPNALIIAIEPDPRNFSYLETNTTFYPNVHCLRKAVWNKPSSLGIFDRGTGNWGYQTRETSDEAPQVEAITLSQVMDKFQIPEISLLKMDIEGAEKTVFSSGFEFWLEKTKAIAIELHEYQVTGASETFFTAIKPFGFSVKKRGENIICLR